MQFSYTRHQTPRGAKPDAVAGDKIYLLKKVGELRLTYQIRLLTYMAQTQQKTLIIRLPKEAKVHSSLRDYVGQMGKLIKIERG